MRVGLYRGSFSPIHNGHVAAAKAFMEQMWLDVLYILPSATAQGNANTWQRLKMCELAFDGVDGVLISDYEIRSLPNGGAERIQSAFEQSRRILNLSESE